MPTLILGVTLQFMTFPSTGAPFEVSVAVRVTGSRLYLTVDADVATVSSVGRGPASGFSSVIK